MKRVLNGIGSLRDNFLISPCFPKKNERTVTAGTIRMVSSNNNNIAVADDIIVSLRNNNNNNNDNEEGGDNEPTIQDDIEIIQQEMYDIDQQIESITYALQQAQQQEKILGSKYYYYQKLVNEQALQLRNERYNKERKQQQQTQEQQQQVQSNDTVATETETSNYDDTAQDEVDLTTKLVVVDTNQSVDDIENQKIMYRTNNDDATDDDTTKNNNTIILGTTTTPSIQDDHEAENLLGSLQQQQQQQQPTNIIRTEDGTYEQRVEQWDKWDESLQLIRQQHIKIITQCEVMRRTLHDLQSKKRTFEKSYQQYYYPSRYTDSFLTNQPVLLGVTNNNNNNNNNNNITDDIEQQAISSSSRLVPTADDTSTDDDNDSDSEEEDDDDTNNNDDPKNTNSSTNPQFTKLQLSELEKELAELNF